MREKMFIRTLCYLFVAITACGTALAQQRMLAAPPYNGPMTSMTASDAPEAVPFYSNLTLNPCTGCNYDINRHGWFILGPTNCFEPGSTQWIAYSFVAGHSGPLRQIKVSVTDYGLCVAGTRNFTVALYSDNCSGPDTQLAAATVRAPAAPCALTTVNFAAGPALTAGTTYWVACETVGSAQDPFTGVWWQANSAPFYVNFNDGVAGKLITLLARVASLCSSQILKVASKIQSSSRRHLRELDFCAPSQPYTDTNSDSDANVDSRVQRQHLLRVG
jgi:hypothetical protein